MVKKFMRLSLVFQGPMAANNNPPSALEKEQVGTFCLHYFLF